MKETKKSWRQLIIFVNIFIIIIIIGICYGYVENFSASREENIKYTFSNMVSATRKSAGGYLISHQQSCDDWAEYINSRDMTLEEALDFLKSANSIDSVMAHVIEYDTMTGYSTIPDSEGNYIIDYSRHRADFSDVLSSLTNQESGIFITHSYTNPIDDKQVIGFCRNIELNQEHSCMLIRTVPLDDVAGNWVFPSDFEDAELSLININGDFIIRSESMTGDNFWEYIYKNNQVSDEEIKTMVESLDHDETIFRERYNAEGELCYFTLLPSMRQGNWYYVGYILKDSIENDSVDFTMVFIVTIGFFFLIVINLFYFTSVNRQLRENAEEIYRANQAKTHFLSSMSHDIRTPMNAIIGMTTLSMKHTNDPDYIKESLEKINLASNHLLTLVNDILDISKVESGKLSLNPTVFSLAESVSNLVNIVRPQIKEKEQEFNIHIVNIDNEYIFADELRLNQIFINLLTNAVKYTPNRGRINLELKQENSETTSNVILTYTVSDTGIGMTEDFQKNMYSTFTRASDSRIDKIQGSGLGLAITKQMVELMGGSIECKSEIGTGTTFIVKIELLKAENIVKEFKLPPVKVLIVDDDEIFLETAKDMFVTLGAEADTAESGRKAIEMFNENSDAYSIIIVDWKMPIMDGIDTIRELRTKSKNKNIPVLVVSAYDWTEIEEEAINAGANGFISKPFFRSTVYKKVLDILNVAENVESKEENYESFAGLRILVAEDNDINWEIISEILDGFDIYTERAENGQECVDMINKDNSFDAIFMDIQMPVMNGRKATEVIRASSNWRLKQIPIIAMTADAFAEDIQACIEAGMNGHIAKPIDVKKIFEELRKAGVQK